MEDKSERQLSLFQKDLCELFGEFEMFNDDELMDCLLAQLPKTFSAKLVKNNLFNIQLL